MTTARDFRISSLGRKLVGLSTLNWRNTQNSGHFPLATRALAGHLMPAVHVGNSLNLKSSLRTADDAIANFDLPIRCTIPDQRSGIASQTTVATGFPMPDRLGQYQ